MKNDKHPFPGCTLPTELFNPPTINLTVPLEFAYCRPRKASQLTLGPSGSILGLAPSEHLSQTGGASILKQLVEKGVIEQPIFSVTLVGKGEGVLSIGGTIAEEVEKILEETRRDLDAAGGDVEEKTEEMKKVEADLNGDDRESLAESDLKIDTVDEVSQVDEAGTELIKRGLEADTGVGEWTKDWAWAKTQGAEGWWQILMPSVWVDGMKVLKNQAVVIDVSDTPIESTQLTRLTHQDQYALHTSPTTGRERVLRLHLWCLPARASAFQLLRLPLSESSSHRLRIRREQVRVHAEREGPIW